MAVLIPRPQYPPYSASERDEGREEVDRILAQTEREVHKVYEQAAREMKKKADDFLAAFKVADRERAIKVAKGEMTFEEYKRWRNTQILTGRRWYEMAYVLASDMASSNLIASTIINKSLPDVFAVGFNYALYQGEITGGFQTSFSLYDRDTVIRLISEVPDLLPVQAKLNVAEDIRWNKKQIASSITQSIVQGETIDEMATRLAQNVTGMNENVAMRNARTASTSAENGGRYNGYRRLRDAGVDLTVEWQATLDSRTRHTHRLLDGQRREVDEPFEVDGQKILYAGDPYAPQGLIWNCRCTMLCWAKGFEESYEVKAKAFPNSEYESYTEWKFAKQEEAERRAQAAKKPRVNPDNPSYGYAADFPQNANRGLTSTSESGIINTSTRTFRFSAPIGSADEVNEKLAAMAQSQYDVWQKSLSRAHIIVDDSIDVEHYNPIDKTVNLRTWSSGETVFHEVSHSIDDSCIKITSHTSGKVYRMRKWREFDDAEQVFHGASRAIDIVYDAMADDESGMSSWLSDMESIWKWLGIPSQDGTPSATDEQVRAAIYKALGRATYEYGDDAAAVIGDMIDAITIGRYMLYENEIAGHGAAYWRSEALKRYREAWADVSALHAMGDEKGLELLRKVMPSTMKATETVWRCLYETGQVEIAKRTEDDRRIYEKVLRITAEW